MRVRLLGISAVLALCIAELAARIAFDFPLYDADSEQGYRVRPNQSGAFLFSKNWVFNGDGLGVAEDFQPSPDLDVLLVGDSIVYGGNELDQEDKLGPLLEAKSGWQVWPAGAGSWGLQNELAFLRDRPELAAGSDVIVFVVNSGDFDRPSEWRSPYTHPRERPVLYLPYLFTRYVLEPETPQESPLPVAERDVFADFSAFVRDSRRPVYVLAYSSQAEAGQNCAWVPERFTTVGTWFCYDAMGAIGPDAFRDPIHPSVEGNKALAAAMFSLIARDGEVATRPASRETAVR